MIEKWKSFLRNGKGTSVFIGIAVVAAMIIIFWPSEPNATLTPETTTAEADQPESELSAQIADMVSAITGEEHPHVTVTLLSSGETVYATENRQSERNAQEYDGNTLNKTQTDGDTEKTYILVKASDGSQQPLIVTRTKPVVQGVVIVSRMGNNIQVKEQITQAVKTALDLSSTQVCVTGYAEYT